ncbi:MAG: glycoside hydrolase family 2 TIM barrel-domain containing protein [Bacillota bacterium]|nr:glycoside hydrolase family 2 TIM barrel-domain containing protein [Bacillota bacterium]
MNKQQNVFQVPENPGQVYNMNLDWKFFKPEDHTWPLAAAYAGAADSKGRQFYEIDYDDQGWEDVSLPHTFNDRDSFRSVANDSGDVGIYRGFAFYRKHFTLPQEHAGKKVFIEFEGVRQAAYVYLNGAMAGYYEAGVTPFGFDLSKHVRFGGPNVLAVALDNTSSRDAAPGTYIRETRPGTTPGSNTGVEFQWNTKDFNPVFGGLTRNVRLCIKNQVYQTLPLYSNLKTKGIYVYAADFDIEAKMAVIHVESEVRNELEEARDLHLEVVVVDHQGQIVTSFTSPVTTAAPAKDRDQEYLTVVPPDAYDAYPAPTDISSRDSTVLKASGQAEGLVFWSPETPYLYKVYSILKAGSQVLDTAAVTTGFRKLEVKGGRDGGVFINEQYYWLTGYAQRAANEWAVIGIGRDWLKEYDAKLIRESNANFIRWMHIAAQPGDIRAADKYGIVCVQPAGDKEKDVEGRQWDQRVEVMRDTIIYFRNSPSILFWEAGNASITAEHMREMVGLRRALDPYGRPMGCRSLEDPQAVAESEWVGTMLGRRVRDREKYHEHGKWIRDQRAIIETEYHREESPRRVWDDFSPPDFDYINVFTGANGAKQPHKDAWDLTQEDFIIHHVYGYYEFWSRRVQAGNPEPYYSAAAMMIWSDSNQHGRLQATENCRMSGRVDPIRIKKPSFYAMQTLQSPNPKVFLVGHWNYPTDPNAYVYRIKDPITHEFTGELGLRDAANKTIYVVGSEHIRAVELFVNGKSVGCDDNPKFVFLYRFPGVNIMQPGCIEAVGYDADGKVVARHRVETVGEVAAIRLRPAAGPNGLMADGADIAFVDVEVVDAQGRVVPLDFERIDFEVTGPAVFLGGYNSGIKDLNHDPGYVYAECGLNRVFLRATREAGPITITARRKGLAPASVTITSKPFPADAGGLSAVMPQTADKVFTGTAIKPAAARGALPAAAAVEARAEIKVFAHNQPVDFGKGLYAYRMAGAYGPILPLLDRLGVEYVFDQTEQKLTAKRGTNTVVTRLADSEMYVNGVPDIINDWPEMINGVLYAELSAVVPALGFAAFWAGGGTEYHIVEPGNDILV